MKTLIIGGVAGGASAAARLRRLDERHEIILFERGDYISFANCGLPYYVGGKIPDEGDLLLQTPGSFKQKFLVDVRVRSEVVTLDRARKVVTVLADGATYEESYDRLILAPGAEPIVPNIPGAKLEGVFTLRNIPDARRIISAIDERGARRAVVVGGGAIGLELAENLIMRGLNVVLVEMAPQLAPQLDFEMAQFVRREAMVHGLKLRLGSPLEAIEKLPNGGLKVTAGGEAHDCDMAVLALGVRPESALARAAGLEVSARGAIVVDSHMRTSDDSIYAVGDAVEVANFVSGQRGSIPLAGPANKQGRIAADNIADGQAAGVAGSHIVAGSDDRNILKIESEYSGTQGSSIIKLFGLTIASTGLNERQAKQLGLNYDKIYSLSQSHAGYYPGAEEMNIKIIFSVTDGAILGAQIVGRGGVDKRLDVIATALRLGGTMRDLTRLELCYAPPFGSAKDPVNMCGFAAENVLNGLVKQYHWHDVEALRADPQNVFLDVRTAEEFAGGHIDGAVNLPLYELRSAINDLDTDKAYFVNCRSGMRSYNACRILSQRGFSCASLGGGYQMYEAATSK